MLVTWRVGLSRHLSRASKSGIPSIVSVGLQSRPFHATPQPRFLDACLSQTHTLITSLHSVTGLPWVATLPLTALCVRGVLILPLALYANDTRQRMISVSPIINAWSHIIRARVFKENKSLGPAACHRLLVAGMSAKSKEIYNDFGIKPATRFVTWLQLPAWLLVIETIRKMCGTNEGLLGLISKPFKPLANDASGEAIMEATRATSIPIEQTLSTEGGLWFTDLLAPDPLLVLPFALSASLFLNVYYQEFYNRSIGSTHSTFSRRLANVSKGLALAIGPLTLQVPTAMLIYWLSSSVLALFQNVIMDRYLSKTPVIKPCKPRHQVQLTGP